MKLSVSKRNQPIQKIDLGRDVLASDYSETIFLIGRSKECHVVLDDKQISREHVRIIHKNGKWFAEKTSENNACLYNGEDFNRAELENGDTLSISSFTITVENEDTVIDTPVPEKSKVTEIKSEPTRVEPSIVAPAPKKVEEKSLTTARDSDATGEIDTSVLLSDEVVETNHTAHRTPTTGEATGDIEVPSDFQSFDQEEKAGDDEFALEENNETDAEVALGLNAEAAEGEGHEMVPVDGEENASYSLENIDGGGDDESTKVIQTFAKVQLELFGETAPYDKFLLEADKTYIGRDPSKCQIVLNDSEVSSVHAVITKNNLMVTLEDLNSSNGTLLNGDRINKSMLNHNDEFVIGAVTFTVKFRSDFLKEENQRLMAVDENQTVEVEEVVEVQAEEGETINALGEIESEAPVEKSIIKRIWKDDKKRKQAIYVIAGLALAYVMFMPDEQPQAPKRPKKAASKSIDKPIVNTKTGKKLSDEEKSALSARYEIGKNHYQNGRYREALEELQKIANVDPNFNSSLQSLISLSKDGLAHLEELERKRQAEQAAAEKKIKVKDLVAKAAGYTKDRRVELAQEVFNEIAKIDPENMEITSMKREL